MKRGILVAALCIASVAHAAERTQQPKKKSAETTQKSAAPSKAAPSKEVLSDLKSTKQAYAAAVGACARPDVCVSGSRSANRELIDLLTSAQENFMTACKACSTDEKCEKESQRIYDGKQSLGLAPCK